MHGVQQCAACNKTACTASNMDTARRTYNTACATHPNAHTCSVSIQRGTPSMDTRKTPCSMCNLNAHCSMNC
eukprot:15435977-Alexandrium_andersonii.AAC.1